MKPKVFEKLLESVREGGVILRGQRKPSRRFEIRASRIRAIRERTSLSQSEFAHLIGVSVKTLQNWEQGRRKPTGVWQDETSLLPARFWLDPLRPRRAPGSLRSGPAVPGRR